ncbi:gland protein G16H02, partial [Aphelenchoides avenae]
MVSVRSATWTVVLVELVLSCAMVIALLAIVSAQAQSVTKDGTPLEPSGPTIVSCILSFLLMISTIIAMFGLSHHKGLLLLPHLCLSVIICCFHAVLTIQWLVSWAETGQPIDGDWL